MKKKVFLINAKKLIVVLYDSSPDINTLGFS